MVTIDNMQDIDVLSMDGKLLATFKTVFDEGSVTRAAQRLEVSQSTVSHALDRLRQVFGDPLFVRAGRSIAPTERARALAPMIAEVLERLQELAEPGDFDPAKMTGRFVLSANDYERELLAPGLVSRFIDEAPNARLALIDTKGQVVESLRARACDVMVTPILPGSAYDLHAQGFFDDTYCCVFDPARLSAEEVTAGYGGLRHAVVVFSRHEPSLIDEALRKTGKARDIVVEAPSFGALPSLLKGTRLVATLPSRLAPLFTGLAACPVPFEAPKLQFQMLWHRTTHHAPKYRWFRALVREALGAARN